MCIRDSHNRTVYNGGGHSIITDHSTQFRGKLWKENLGEHGIKTYKTSVYHPNSNPAERMLWEVRRLLRTDYHNEQKRWHEYVASTKDFLNFSHHNTIEVSPYTVMFERPPPREIKAVSYTHLDVYKRQMYHLSIV